MIRFLAIAAIWAVAVFAYPFVEAALDSTMSGMGHAWHDHAAMGVLGAFGLQQSWALLGRCRTL